MTTAGQLAASGDGVTVPRKLTAENGAKAALSGEFAEQVEVMCPICGGHGENPDDDSLACSYCDGDGTVTQIVQVSWTTIKAIYAAAIAHFEEGL